MRSKVGAACAFVGAFLVIFAIVAQTWVADQLARTPLDVDSVTRLSGEATQYNDGEETTFAVKATSTTKADSEASDDDVVVFKSSTCLVRDEGDVGDCVSADDPEGRLLSAGFDDFATDRRTGESVNDAKYLPGDAVEHEGLVNKWPFHAEKKDYTYWVDPVAADAVYDRTERVDGLETYVYRVEVTDVPITITEGVEGLYSETTELWIAPTTGQIVDQVSTQVRQLEDGSPFLDLELSFTDDQVAANVEEIGSASDSLNLVTRTVPILGYAIGVPLLLLGIGLVFLGSGRGRSSKDDRTVDGTPTRV